MANVSQHSHLQSDRVRLARLTLAKFVELRRLRVPSFCPPLTAALLHRPPLTAAVALRRGVDEVGALLTFELTLRACAAPACAEPSSGGAAQRRRAPWRPAAWRVSSVCGLGRLRARLAPVSGPVVGVEALGLSHSPRPCGGWHRIACFSEPGAAWRSRRRGYALSTHMWTMSRWSGVRRLRLKNRPLGPLGHLLDLYVRHRRFCFGAGKHTTNNALFRNTPERARYESCQ